MDNKFVREIRLSSLDLCDINTLRELIKDKTKKVIQVFKLEDSAYIVEYIDYDDTASEEELLELISNMR